jgi:YidC/Oxa1 family membrane protein insertase
LRDVVARPEGRASMQFSASELAEEGQKSMTEKNSLGYVGVDAQYFASILLPEKPLTAEWFDERWALRLGPEPNPKKTRLTFTDVTCRLQRKPADLEAGGERRDSYVVFCGPKRPKLLAKYEAGDDPNYNLGDLVYYGWPIWGVVARVMSGILHWFYGLVGNYGISILLLTVVVRLCMFPLSRKQALNMAKMQELKPEMDKINEKYKKDLEKRTKAQQELWRSHNYNPMGGCLLAFVQLPIFLGLYRALMVDIELRQAPLISDSIRWCSDLAAPDMLWNWSNVMPAFVQGWLGPYLNVLPLVTVGLFVAQQKLFMPPPMNEQAAMQQKMMSFMMIFIGFLFFKVASGLCIYFIASSLWGIAERKLLPKATVPDQPTTAEKAAPTDAKAPRTEKRQSGGTPQRNGHPAGGKKKTRSKRKK